MAVGRNQLLCCIDRFRAAPLVGLPDGELLRRFALGQADAGPAFEIVVRRHGPLVLRVCRSVLGNVHAAEDCFQATFLVLVRRVRAIRYDRPLGPWLFGVARRICHRARVAAARRARHERVAAVPVDAVTSGRLDPDVAVLVHDEVGRLPRALKTVAVLCDLAGLTYQEAADRLGVPHATVRGRLARAREHLRHRLTRKGIGPDILPAVPLMVPTDLLSRTAQWAAVFAGQATGTVPATVLNLVNGGLYSMFVMKAKSAGLFTLTAGLLISGALGLGARQDAKQPAINSAGGGVSQLPTSDDPGDQLATVVRRAQRQEDRGNLAGAQRTLEKADDALRKWRDQLELRQRHKGDRGTELERESGAEDAATAAAAQFLNRGLQTATPKPSGVPGLNSIRPDADLESRMRDMEKKMDRLLRELDKRNQNPNPSADQPRR
ncbi:MAG TPA: sigma-70 family RNA polymerase sigma factor [Gemmataceae bacterium]|nr:sigma-70 family RNA polymerase sigma factor [Gemmataceae bacterium]